MKIVINYDLMNAIKDVKEPYGPLKIIRNEKKAYMLRTPLWFLIDYYFIKDVGTALGILSIQYMLSISGELMAGINFGIDEYATLSAKKLRLLVQELNNMGINTSYDMLLKSEMYEKLYKVEFNESKLPFLMQEKYILMPAEGYNGQVRDISVLQEHQIGSNDYVLSLASPSKKRKLVKTFA